MLLPLSHAALLMSSLMGSAPGTTEAAAPLRLAQTNPIKGTDTMDDKGRSGPDGWVEAPMSRDTAASGADKASGETKSGQAPTSAMSKSAGNKPMNSGNDPGTPSDPKGPNPGNAPK